MKKKNFLLFLLLFIIKCGGPTLEESIIISVEPSSIDFGTVPR